MFYLEATPNALLNLNGASSGSFYAFAIQTSTGQNGCQAQANLYKAVNGTVSVVANTSVGCGMFYSAIAAPDGSLRLLVPAANGELYEPLIWSDPSTPLTGAAGIAAAGPGDGTAATLWQAALYTVSRVAPSAVDPSTIQTYVRATEADIRTPGTLGVYQYQWYRDGQFLTATFNPELSDASVSAGSTHTYGVNATDIYSNTSATTSFTVTTPASTNIDPREIGLRSTGSYWGGMGEQIDVRSGNLNYSYPVLAAVSRGSPSPGPYI